MAGYTRTYTFLGVGVIWDKEDNRALCRFSKDGKFTTSDPVLIQKLLRYGIPHEDSKVNILARNEYVIDLLQERVRLLEKMNEEQKALIDDLKNRNAVDSGMPSRDNIIAELDFLGAPYIAISQDSTLLYVLHEFKAALRDKARREANAFGV